MTLFDKKFWFIIIGSFILYTMYLFICCPSIPFELGFYITIFFMEMVMLLCMLLEMQTQYGDVRKTRKVKFLEKLLEDNSSWEGFKRDDKGFFYYDAVCADWKEVK